MVSKKFVIFAVGSMFAAGATLASNVSFGQRASRWVAENMEFMGPISGLVNAVVRNNEYNNRKPILGYQTGNPEFNSGSIRASQPLELAAFRSAAGQEFFAGGAYSDKARSIPSIDPQNPRALIAGGSGGITFSNIVGDNNSELNDLAKRFLRKGTSFDDDLLGLLGGKGGLTAGQISVNDLGGAPAASGDSDIPTLLAAATNGNSLLSSSSLLGSANDGSLNGNLFSNRQNNAANVPVPGTLVLLGLGVGIFGLLRKRQLQK
jgi:PEP-CTERM motif